jgi:hypothetical protein
MKLSPEEKMDYDVYIKNWRREYGLVAGNFDRGRMEERYEVVRKGFAQGLEINVLSQLTGLSEDEIRKMRDELN